MSHHYSGPDFGFPHGDARLDFTDLYAFPKAGDSSKQTATLRRAEGAQAAQMGDEGKTIVEAAPVSTGREAKVTAAGDYRFFAGWRGDPFFFDAVGALNKFQFTGQDFFADKNICTIVLELPNAQLGSKKIGLWARTLASESGKWVQVDRGAGPQQSIFLPGDDRNAYLAGEPAGDSRFIATFAHSLEHTGGYTPEEAKRVANTLLPDIMPYDPSRPASFPKNGRTLTDDAVDHFLGVLTNGKLTGDGVGPHSDLLTDFPYVAPPHAA